VRWVLGANKFEYFNSNKFPLIIYRVFILFRLKLCGGTPM
jgi:hypothetical protein